MKPLTKHLSAALLLAALSLTAAVPALAQEYTFLTLAGPPGAGPGAIDGPGSVARFNQPCGVAVDSAGNVYVADTSNDTIRKVTPGGVVTTLVGLVGVWPYADGTGSAARFVFPGGVAVDSTGNLYVADTWNSTIRKVTPGGVVTTLAGLPGVWAYADGTGSAARFDRPQAVAVDTNGNVYVADAANDTIRKVTPAGVVTTLAGLAGTPGTSDGTSSAARFDNPGGVALDSAGDLYVADTYNTTIRKVTPAGVVTTSAGLAGTGGSADGAGSAARFSRPSGVAVDSAGNLYVADPWNNTIRKVTPDGLVTTLAGLAESAAGCADGTASAARFSWPTGVALDTNGNAYVADQNNNTVRKVTPAGLVSTLAGLAVGVGSADGTGSAAQFRGPCGVAVDTAGMVYVADTTNSTIRKVTPGRVVTTLAGLAGSGGSADGTGSAARFSFPAGVAVDPNGNVLVADTENSTIRRVTPGGVVTTLAGLAGTQGSWDGWGSDARFNDPYGVAVDPNGNVFVADTGNCTIREVRPAETNWLVGTLAGIVGRYFDVDGSGTLSAQFCWPWGLAVDSACHVYVADIGASTIRMMTCVGVVTTLAGLADNEGLNDGTGSAARFYRPSSLAVDAAGNVYVADTDNCTIRKVTPAGVVTTLAGAYHWGSADGTGTGAQFYWPSGVAADGAGNLYVADTMNGTIRIGRPACPDMATIDQATGPVGQTRQLDTSPQTAVAWQWSLIREPSASSASLSAANVRNPTFTPDVPDLYIFQLQATNAAGAVCIRTLAFTATPPPPSVLWQPQTQTAELGSPAWFGVEVTNAPPDTSYQWGLNGTALSGETNSWLELPNVAPGLAGPYTIVVTDMYGSTTSTIAALSVIAPVPRRTVPMLDLTGDAGSFLHLIYADTLGPASSWQQLNALTLTNPPQLYLDLSSPVAPSRFYRAWQTNLPTLLPAVSVGMAEELTLTGAVGSNLRIDYINQIGPTNAWVTLATVTLTNTTQPFFDLTMWRQPNRLYRLVPPA